MPEPVPLHRRPRNFACLPSAVFEEVDHVGVALPPRKASDGRNTLRPVTNGDRRTEEHRATLEPLTTIEKPRVIARCVALLAHGHLFDEVLASRDEALSCRLLSAGRDDSTTEHPNQGDVETLHLLERV